MKYLLCGVILISIISCNSNSSKSEYIDYIETAFDSIQQRSIKKHSLNFDSIKNIVLSEISDTSSIADVHLAIEKANNSIDRHGYVIFKEQFKKMIAGKNPDVQLNPYPFSGKILKDKYGFISLDGFIGMDSISSRNYADSLQSLVFSLYQRKPKGWIIDLRNNSGGWLYPMLFGLGPILGKGIKAYKIDSDTIVEEFYYWKTETEHMTLNDDLRFLDKNLPTVIMIGEETGSAGELLTLCFRGNPLTTIVGQNSYGVSTGLSTVIMPDSFVIAVTNNIMTDRNKIGNGEAIKPNLVSNNWVEAFNMSYNWIEKNQVTMSN